MVIGRVFWQFLLLGLASFGGPAAHLGYFQRRFVNELGWLSQGQYSQLVALSQMLPGPGSSQVGFAIGYLHGGVTAAIAAFVGFTLPSFVLMLTLALSASHWLAWPVSTAIVSGLKLVALVVVADAVWQMSRQFCHDRATWLIAALTAVVMLLTNQVASQMLALLAAALWGLWHGRTPAEPHNQHTDSAAPSKAITVNWMALFTFAALSAYLLWPTSSPLSALASDYYQAGALVFGGGHVVLPLLQGFAGDSVTSSQFLTGYAAAQAVPGPMFTVATYLGAVSMPTDAVMAALVATIAIFLPGLLLMWVCVDSWQAIAQRPRFLGAVASINAAVVGLLFSALYDPVFTSAVAQPRDLALALIAMVLLRQWRWPILAVIALVVATMVLLAL